ncbi:hypothetical protein HK097_004355 [Rhizophlyctis rosea]|uniref:AB hydrolase-1 domain-containing protein n=1 Tax=Rhizophlyctis rosea TaxID=64517 RepID=A0AAD5X2T5_9FUNG|nr:hypothetical protein HK097_004355 [Rhizophlyctis rosea]
MNVLIRRTPAHLSPIVRNHASNSSVRHFTINPKENQTLQLPDGRTLGFAEYGTSTGYPLFFFHGFPSSRLEARVCDSLAHKRNIRIISPDRPGFGLSTFQPNRRITDWPKDVKALADHLDIDRCAILGGSGGGPYALACAHAFPHDMMSAVGVMAGAPPWEGGSHHMSIPARLTRALATTGPSGVTWTLDQSLSLSKWFLSTKRGTATIDNLLDKEKAALGVQSLCDQREEFLWMLMEGFAQGSKATTQESNLLSDNGWGFRFEDIDYRIQVWHGEKDWNAPIVLIRHMVERLPNAELVAYDDTNHFAIAKRLEEIMVAMLPPELRSSSSKSE